MPELDELDRSATTAHQAAEIIGGLFATEWQSDRVTEWQTLKGTQYRGERNFFVPDFNKLPYSLRSQGDYLLTILKLIHAFQTFVYRLCGKQLGINFFLKLSVIDIY